jgi:hypothetical protein
VLLAHFKVGNRLAINLGKVLQFDEIDASLTGLELRDKGLRFEEPLGDLGLSQSSALAGLSETTEKQAIFFDVVGGLQGFFLCSASGSGSPVFLNQRDCLSQNGILHSSPNTPRWAVVSAVRSNFGWQT